MTTICFASGEEQEYDADSAVLVDTLFVLYKYNRKRRKLESRDTFPANEVLWALLPSGNIVVGTGRRKEPRR